MMLFFTLTAFKAEAQQPNILFIIADDMGVDTLKKYNIGTLNANTPHLDSLMHFGLTFTNVWASPVCSATRAALMTGKYGINNGVNTVPGNLSTDHKSIFKELKDQTNNTYNTCVIGKWHLTRGNDHNHPFEHGVDHFMGLLKSGVKDYYEWEKYENGTAETCSTYATTYFTDYAVNWIKKQKKPWFMWLAHVTPHAPFQTPPKGTYSTTSTFSNKDKYIAMIESLDHEIGRLVDGIPKAILNNTLTVFLGDNGTPGRMVSGFPLRKGKGTLYQGGINVPLIISGKGVTRLNETEDALINISDFYTTFSQFVNPNAFPSDTYYNGTSFKHLLDGSKGKNRSQNFMSLGPHRRSSHTMHTVRNQRYKLLDLGDGTFEFYDLVADPFELNNLLATSLTTSQKAIKIELINTMQSIVGLNH